MPLAGKGEVEVEENCLVCRMLQLWKEGDYPYFVHEFDLSIMVLSFHQFYRGYCMLLLKNHVRDLHDMSEEQERLFYTELMRAGRAIYRTFKPWKMNYANYGNRMQHIHWHAIPRYEGDPNLKVEPWANKDRFRDYEISSSEARDIARLIRPNIPPPTPQV